TTPAAQNGIHSIWIAHTATPAKPNSAKLMNSSRVGPMVAYGVYRRRSIQSSGQPLPYFSIDSRSARASRYSSTPRQNTVPMPFFTGLCGSSSVSHLAWCLRWMATHSRVTIEVVSQPQKRKKCATAGWKSTPRCAWLRCRYRVTVKMVSWVATSRYTASASQPGCSRPPARKSSWEAGIVNPWGRRAGAPAARPIMPVGDNAGMNEAHGNTAAPPRRALVTGASGAIGAAICRRLAADGFHVVVHGTANRARDEAVAAAIHEAGGTAGAVAFDVADAGATAAAMQALLADWPVHVVVNNAGIHDDAPMAGMDQAR